MKRLIFCLFIAIQSLSGTAQTPNQHPLNPDKPKLVVGVVVDQMRYDYLTRFWDKFGEDGFKRLIREGYNFKNNNFNYVPTYTAPGHTSIYTGTTPENHGIISNGWYDKYEKSEVYCTEDASVNSIGTQSTAGKMSPHRMNATTVADENRLFTQLKGKTIGISLKDRGAILPAGHTANAAYWFNGRTEGKFISSSYYMEELPEWVTKFNSSNKVRSYLKEWNTIKDITTYTESGSDKNTFEGGFVGQETATFPYDLKKLSSKNGDLDILKSTPYGNSILADFAIATLEEEDLGEDEFTDFFTISFSSTDYIGHNFGVDSKEVEDAYIRLDVDLSRILRSLDEKVGEGNYTLFLTADHGGGDVPSYLQSVRVPGGYFDELVFENDLKEFLKANYKNEKLLESVSNYQVFFNYQEVLDADISFADLEQVIARYAINYKQVNRVFTRTNLEGANFMSGLAGLVQKGFNQKRSGDVVLVLDPATITYSVTGSTHGSGYSYDTHAPLIFFGKGIPHGSTTKPNEIVDIAPTISTLLGIPMPNSTTGKPLYEMLDASKN
ncbi:Type I phosphodiesterase / nucleotide pyrophosphatase [Gillisia sp. Hel1_33_143]|uniref:alkaline phosphatase PafA n=1 Tax=Gillisia sp. Hel1_33_143 TaxID=1336796 RepID=UPI00087B041F|nr:alkaline phosphatase PafA [Gillisia sp. Hel1_33_143]SDS04711.1 Type I phosphodiesterase / nucleotide pyrophosphatase [Gillisia sp. Hel1_33_143]